MDKRIGVIGIVIDNMEVTQKLNSILHEYADIILGRMGLPYKQRKINVISLIVEGTTDEIGALSGKLGNLPGVNVKSALSKAWFTDTPVPFDCFKSYFADMVIDEHLVIIAYGYNKMWQKLLNIVNAWHEVRLYWHPVDKT